MRNARLDNSQARIKIVGRNNNNLRYVNDTTVNSKKQRGTKQPLDESEKGEWKAGLKFNAEKMKTMATGPITFWQVDREKVETITDFLSLGSKITVDGDCTHEIKRHWWPGRKLWQI